MNNLVRCLFFVFVFMMITDRAEAIELWLPLEQRVTINCDFCGYTSKGRCHGGIDLYAPTSVPVYAAATGQVVKAVTGLGNTRLLGFDDKTAYGNYVKIKHAGGWTTIYAHLNTVIVEINDPVEAGQIIGTTDNSGNSSGPHLHFEVRNPQNKPVDPYGDPTDQNGCLPDNIPHTCGPNALWATCPPEPYPTCVVGTAEQCNGTDDDCDNQTDEEWPLLGHPCSVGQGACRRNATWVCEPGHRGIVCDVDVGGAQSEICNNIDDDCDGVTDNGANVCDDQSATCANGTCLSCNPPGESCGMTGTCLPNVYNQSRELVIDLINPTLGACRHGFTTYIEQSYYIPPWAQCNDNRIQWRQMLSDNGTVLDIFPDLIFDAWLDGNSRLCGSVRGAVSFSDDYCPDMRGSIRENGYVCP